MHGCSSNFLGNGFCHHDSTQRPQPLRYGKFIITHKKYIANNNQGKKNTTTVGFILRRKEKLKMSELP